MSPALPEPHGPKCRPDSQCRGLKFVGTVFVNAQGNLDQREGQFGLASPAGARDGHPLDQPAGAATYYGHDGLVVDEKE